MDDTLSYLAINRQRGLRAEFTAIATNIANLDTAGYRRQGLVFSEHVHASNDGQSLSMADLNVRFDSAMPGTVRLTGAELDLAIEGEGFFAVEVGGETLLTRAGGFQRSDQGLLVTPSGDPVLDAGQAPIFLPVDGGPVAVSPDGTMSAGGLEFARIGVFTAPAEALLRAGDTHFRPERDAILPVAEPRVAQGALEGSNVDAVAEIARMIEVGRAYDQVQGLIRDEDERIRETIRTLGEPV